MISGARDALPVSPPPVMRAVVLDGMGFEHLAVREVPIPRPSRHQMLARVDAAGICTSLIKLIEQGSRHAYLYGWDLERYPLILGDEGAVTLVQVGEELEHRYSPDQRFVIQPAVSYPPINHRERYRDSARGVGKIAVGYTLGGHLAEYILIGEEILAAECLRPIHSPRLAHAHAALSEPLSCVISSQEHHLHLAQTSPHSPRTVLKGLKPGGLTVIVGVGAMGCMHIDLALTQRPRAILAVGLSARRLPGVMATFAGRAAKQSIALHTASIDTGDVARVVRELSEGQGADDVIVAVGSVDAIESAQHWLAKGGVLNLFGGLKAGEDTVALSSSIIHYRETAVTGSSGGSPYDIDRALQLLDGGSLNTAKHIVRIGDLAHSIDLLKSVRARQIDGKAIVYPHRRTDSVLAVQGWTSADERSYLSGCTVEPALHG